jgi:hypothetical protein
MGVFTKLDRLDLPHYSLSFSFQIVGMFVSGGAHMGYEIISKLFVLIFQHEAGVGCFDIPTSKIGIVIRP